MRQLEGEAVAWAREEFGRAELGDSRRTERLVRLVARAVEAPAGKVSQVLAHDAERQAAYDFLETGHVSAVGLMRTAGAAAVARGGGDEWLYVAVDGSSLTLADPARRKDLGSVGAACQQARGLKVIHALGVSSSGVPVGLCSQVWWRRTQPAARSRLDKRSRNRKRRVGDQETPYWLEAIDEACARANDAGARLWFVLDREADNRHLLLALAQSGQRFTVRCSWNRLVEELGKDRQYLRQQLAAVAAGGSYELAVSAGPKRTARRARMVVRGARVVFRLRDKWRKTEQRLALTAVWTREQGTPVGEKPLGWLLLTNVPIDTFGAAQHIIFGYTQRWRVEEFHKTWKSGACNVEQTQLRTQRAVVLWATMLAAVAVRIERLKLLARSTPAEPADVELSRHEIRALILLKRQIKKRTETISDAIPTIGQATVWIAELGGYTGKSSGGPPGSITIRRGMDRLRPAALLLQALEAEEPSALRRQRGGVVP